MERAFADLAGDEPDEDVAILAAQLGRFLYFAGRPDAAAERLEQALELAEGLHLPAVFSEALNSKSLALGFHGRFEEARSCSTTRSRSRSRTTSALRACGRTTTCVPSTA